MQNPYTTEQIREAVARYYATGSMPCDPALHQMVIIELEAAARQRREARIDFDCGVSSTMAMAASRSITVG